MQPVSTTAVPRDDSPNMGPHVIYGNIDLMQIYPSKTNHFGFQSYQYLANKSLSLTMEMIQGVLISMIVILFISFIFLSEQIYGHGFHANHYRYLIYTLVIFVIMIGLLLIKVYLLYVTHNFIYSAPKNSLYFHFYGTRIYYGLNADVMVSFMIFFALFMVLFSYCITDVDKSWCIERINFDHPALSIITWFVCLPLLIYSIFGIVMLSQLPDFFKQFAYKQFKSTNDAKYCLYFHHSKEMVTYTKCIPFGCCISSNGCGCKGCNSQPKCGIMTLCIWFILMSLICIFGIIDACRSLSSNGGIATVSLFYSLIGAFVHVAAAIYGIKTIYYENGLEFHKNAHYAFGYFSTLFGLYYVAFLIFGGFAVILSFESLTHSGNDYVQRSLAAIILVILFLILTYFPIEAMRMLDKHIQLINYQVGSIPNVIDMNQINYSKGNVQSNVQNYENTKSVSLSVSGGAPVSVAVKQQQQQQQ